MTIERQRSVAEMVEALGVFEEAVFTRRFHEAARRHPDPGTREQLKEIPDIMLESSLAKRLGARVWEREGRGGVSDDFLLTSERLLLGAFLKIAESDIRITTHIARHSPTASVRRFFDQSAEVELRATQILREAIASPKSAVTDEPLEGLARCGQQVGPEGDLRGEVETTVRIIRANGKEPRQLTLSHQALRRLRDQGLFKDGDTTVLGVPVMVDLAWQRLEYSVMTMEALPMEEMVRESE